MNLLSKDAEQQIINMVADALFRALEVNAESNTNSSRFLQAKQAAEYCDVSRQTLQRWVEERGLSQAKIGGVVLYDAQDLDKFIAKYKI